LLGISVSCLVIDLDVKAAERKKRNGQDAINLVNKARAYLREYGRAKTLEEINNPNGLLSDGELYLFVYNLSGDGIALANGGYPAMVGKNMLELRDPDGYYVLRNVLKVANSKDGRGWVYYKWPSAKLKYTVEEKASYVERVDDMVFGCGLPRKWLKNN
jgi:cytochrome c